MPKQTETEAAEVCNVTEASFVTWILGLEPAELADMPECSGSACIVESYPEGSKLKDSSLNEKRSQTLQEPPNARQTLHDAQFLPVAPFQARTDSLHGPLYDPGKARDALAATLHLGVHCHDRRRAGLATDPGLGSKCEPSRVINEVQVGVASSTNQSGDVPHALKQPPSYSKHVTAVPTTNPQLGPKYDAGCTQDVAGTKLHLGSGCSPIAVGPPLAANPRVGPQCQTSNIGGSACTKPRIHSLGHPMRRSGGDDGHSRGALAPVDPRM